MAKKEKTSSHPEGKGLLLLGIAFLFILSLLSFDIDSRSSNWLGVVGHGIAYSLSYLFGITIFPIIGLIGWIGWKLLLRGEFPQLKSKIFYFSVFALSFSILMNLAAEKGMPIPGALKHKILTESITLELPFPQHSIRHNLGGVPFYYLYKDLDSFHLQRMLSDVGIAITFSLTMVLSLMFLMEVKVTEIIQKLSERKKEEPLVAPEQIEKKLSQLIPSESKTEIRIRTLEEKKSLLEKPRPSTTCGYELPPPPFSQIPKKSTNLN